MAYRYVGKTGLLVSPISLGTLNFGVQEAWGADKNTSIAVINKYLDAGGNFIDTADIYNKGMAEEIIGEAFKDNKKRDAVVLGTKCLFRTGPSPNDKSLSRKHMMEACEASLRRLQTDYIDLYMVHGPDPYTPPEETMRTLDDLVRQGKVRYIGCSNFFSWQILKANGIGDRMNLEKFVCGQYMYNLVNREVEREILPACADQGMGFTSWSPLAGGLLTGKYKGMTEPPKGSRIDIRKNIDIPRFWHQKGLANAGRVISIAEKHGISPLKIALSWVLRDSRITSVIIGVKNIQQLEEDLIAGEFDLHEDIWEEVNRATMPEQDFLERFQDFIKERV